MHKTIGSSSVYRKCASPNGVNEVAAPKILESCQKSQCMLAQRSERRFILRERYQVLPSKTCIK
ncbi:hypothetical protein [uncultured Helicobacter sp.]|uniref:hypothetical protein n=1 Tax=uncultured Helicobacter sp. TaxID=175537 RepID=UPI003752BE23